MKKPRKRNPRSLSRELPEEPREPWRPTPRMKSVFSRIWAAASSAVLGFLTLNSVVAPDAWSNPISWGVLAAFALLSALLPSVGALFACEALGVSLCVFGSPVLGVAFMAAAACWWYFTARHSREAANAGLLPAAYRIVRICTACSLCVWLFAASSRCGGNHVVCRRSCPNAFRLGVACSFGLGCVFLCPGSSCWQRPRFGCRFARAAFDVDNLGGLGCCCRCFVGFVRYGQSRFLHVGHDTCRSIGSRCHCGWLVGRFGWNYLACQPLALVPVIAALVVAVALTCTAAPSRAFVGEGE